MVWYHSNKKFDPMCIHNAALEIGGCCRNHSLNPTKSFIDQVDVLNLFTWPQRNAYCSLCRGGICVLPYPVPIMSKRLLNRERFAHNSPHEHSRNIHGTNPFRLHVQASGLRCCRYFVSKEKYDTPYMPARSWQ